MAGGTGMSPWLGIVLPLQNGRWEALGMALDCREHRLQAGLRGSSVLLLVAIRAHGSGYLSGRTGCKHEKSGRGVVAPETRREQGGFCALSRVAAWVIVPHHPCCL